MIEDYYFHSRLHSIVLHCIRANDALQYVDREAGGSAPTEHAREQGRRRCCRDKALLLGTFALVGEQLQLSALLRYQATQKSTFLVEAAPVSFVGGTCVG